MPIYEYKCDRCEEVFEVRQKFADEPLTEHEKCGGAVRRLMSAPALQFKGTGWYITDYGRSGSGKSGESKGESKDSSSSESKESKSESKESKSDSKSDSKTESNGSKSSGSESKSSAPPASTKSESKSDSSSK